MSDEPRTEKERIYDNEVSPLMTQIIAICKEHKINMAATFSLDIDPEPEQPLYCTTILRADKSDEDGSKRMDECDAVMYPQHHYAAITIVTTPK